MRNAQRNLVIKKRTLGGQLRAARRRVLQAALAASLVAPTCGFAQNPTGGNLVAGAGDISNAGSVTNINTSSDRAIIDWNNFSIGAGNTVNFNQPAATSAVLNRVIGNSQSLIDGALNSNGNVFLSNPNGVIVGSTGVINTNGFLATTLDITNQKFMDGDLEFGGDSLASVVNNGTISTADGGAHLIASSVINNGTIESQGSINLATGGVLHFAGGRYVQADLGTIANGISGGSNLIKNSGVVRAVGGLNVGGDVYLVNPGGDIVNDGQIVAALSTPDGSLSGSSLVGGDVTVEASGLASISGSIDASGSLGGQVTVTGESVSLTGASIDASGDNGGGDVRIGGGWKGQDASIANASDTFVSADSSINVDATTGDAGTVVVWADGATDFRGKISARALSEGGQGGDAEVSGKETLTFAGNANLVAADGSAGTLLLDPAAFVLDATNEVAIRQQWGTSNLIIEADDSIDINVDLYPTKPDDSEYAFADGTERSLTLREASGGDGAVDITINAAVRDNRKSGSAQTNVLANDGTFTITANGSLQTHSVTNVEARDVELLGSGNIRTLTAQDGLVAIGSNATGTLKLSEAEIGNVGISTIVGTNVDIDSLSTESMARSINLEATNVNIDNYYGQSLSIEADNLVVTGPVVGGGYSTFSFLGQTDASIGLGSAAGDTQLSAAILNGFTGWNTFEIGRTSSTASPLVVRDANLPFNNVILSGSSIELDGLGIGTNLTLNTNSLLVPQAITKTADTGILRISTLQSTSIGIGDSQTGLLSLDATLLDNLGSYSGLNVSSLGGDINVGMDFTDRYLSSIYLDAASGGVGLNGVTTESGSFVITSDDINVTDAFTGDSETTNLTLYTSVNDMSVGDAVAGDWTLDNTEIGNLTQFKSLSLSNNQSNGAIAIKNVDFTTITGGNVSVSADSLVAEDITINESLSLNIENEIEFSGTIQTNDTEATLTISGSDSLGLGDGTTGDTHLAQTEIDAISGFATINATSKAVQIDASFDENIDVTASGSTPGTLTISSLTTTNGGDFKGTATNINANNIDVEGGVNLTASDILTVQSGGIAAGGDVSLRGTDELNIDGDALTSFGDVTLYSKEITIGDGSQAADISVGSADGDIIVSATDLAISGSSNGGAQIGYRYDATTPTVSGDITVNVTGDFTMVGGSTNAQFAAIGHGDGLGNDDTGRTASGDVTVNSNKSISMTRGHIGHMVDATGTYGSGNTSVFVGKSDFDKDNTTDVLTADSNSRFASAAFGTGELRIFVPNLDAYDVANGALFNGGLADPSSGTAPPKNYAGPSDPGNDFLGNYVGDAAANWSIFRSPIELVVDVADGSSTYGDTPTVVVTLDAASEDLFGSDTVASIGLTTDTKLTAASDAGVYTLRGDDDELQDGYRIVSTSPGSFEIEKADLTIQLGDIAKTYGESPQYVGNEFTSSGLKNSDEIANVTITSSGSAPMASAGTYALNGANPTGTSFKASNYNTTFNSGHLTVNKAPLTVAIIDLIKRYGLEAMFLGSEFTATGLVNGDKINSVDLQSDGTPLLAILGDYVLKGSNATGVGFVASNYDVTYEDATLSVVPADDNTSHDAWSRARMMGSSLPNILGSGSGSISGSVGPRVTVAPQIGVSLPVSKDTTDEKVKSKIVD